MNLLTMEFPLSREVMTTVRLATGGVCALVGLGLDEAEDCKVCVTESLLLLMHGGSRSVRVRFGREESANCLRIELLGTGGLVRREKTVEEEISEALLGALVEGLEMEEVEGGTRIGFGFGTL